MARIVSPTQFNWTGSRANEVFYKLFGRSFVRSRPGGYKDLNSPAQQLQRSRFRSGNLLASKVRSYAAYVRENPPVHKSYFSALCSQFIAAYVNNGTAIVFTPKSAIIGSGSLARQGLLTLTKATTSSFTATWDPAPVGNFDQDTDLVGFLIIDQDEYAPRIVTTGVARSVGTATVTVPGYMSSAEVWVSEPFFYSAAGSANRYTSAFAMADQLAPVDLS